MRYLRVRVDYDLARELKTLSIKSTLFSKKRREIRFMGFEEETKF